MESEKVKEIKKALECCANWDGISSCNDCPIGVEKCFEEENLMPKLALTLINELESENDKYKNLYETMYRKYAKLEAETYTKEDVAELKDRIAELEKGNGKNC